MAPGEDDYHSLITQALGSNTGGRVVSLHTLSCLFVVLCCCLLWLDVRGGLRSQVADSSTTKQYLFKRSLQVAHRRRKLLEEGKVVGPALELQYRLLDKVEIPENLASACLCMPRNASILFGKLYGATRLLSVNYCVRFFLVHAPYRPWLVYMHFAFLVKQEVLVAHS